MKALGYKIFLSALIVFGAAFSAFAQDAGMSDVEVLENRDGSEGFTPGEDLRYIPRAPGVTPAKDSIALQLHDFPMQRAAAAQKQADKANEKQQGKAKDDSILTFNFLYYIIQKYKLQDIID